MFNTKSNGQNNSGVDEFLKKIVENTTARAEAFIKELLKLYKDESISIWNGTECKGVTQIGSLLSEIPTSAHTIETIDCQPILSDDKENPNLSITATGKVTYNATSKHNFHHSFLLNRDAVNPNVYYISYDCLRLTN
eukprot:gene4261-5331_t